jgi:hypothetical protein
LSYSDTASYTSSSSSSWIPLACSTAQDTPFPKQLFPLLLGLLFN